MNNYKNFFFDLDGTITDSKESILYCLEKALHDYGIVADISILEKFIGPSLYESFHKYYNFSGNLLDEVIQKYRKYYTFGPMYESPLFHGIEDVFKILKQKHKKLYIATAKETSQAKKIIAHKGLQFYFQGIYGADDSLNIFHKEQVIEHLLKQNNLISAESVMIGDKEHDIFGAKRHGVFSIAVRWGYAFSGELEKSQPDVIVDTIDTLKTLLSSD